MTLPPHLQIPAEIFPTRFRATCHGISAASGKIGAIIILVVTEKTILGNNGKALDELLAAFSVPLFLGALFAWVWIPEIQTSPVDPPRALHLPRLPNKSLERLAKGWSYATCPDQSLDPRTQVPRGEGQKLGFSNKFSDLWHFVRYGGERRVFGEDRLPGGLRTASYARSEHVDIRTTQNEWSS